MSERHKQLQEFLLERDLFQQYTVSDYIFSKTLLFAGQNLVGEELRLFQNLFNTLNASFPKPDLLVYLHRPVDELLENIKKRNRSYEEDISGEYLHKIQQAYFEFFRTHQDKLPILLLDVSGLDFMNSEKDYRILKSALNLEYGVGLHRKTAAELIFGQ
jgi:deoxyadenosine/deoxycytidine kinase